MFTIRLGFKTPFMNLAFGPKLEVRFRKLVGTSLKFRHTRCGEKVVPHEHKLVFNT
jgi:hypothetical protein